MAVTVGTNEPGISPPTLDPGPLPTILKPAPADTQSCGALVVGGLPKESTDERYWDSKDGDELPRDPLSGSPGNPWYISPEGPVSGQCEVSPARQGSGTHKRLLKKVYVYLFVISRRDAPGFFPKKLHEEAYSRSPRSGKVDPNQPFLSNLFRSPLSNTR